MIFLLSFRLSIYQWTQKTATLSYLLSIHIKREHHAVSTINPSLGYSKKNLINTLFLRLLPVLCTWEGIVYNRCVHNFLFQSKKSRQINGALILRKCRFVGLGINVMIRNDCGGSKRWKWLKIVWVQKIEIAIKEDTLEVYSYREIRGLLSYIFLRSVVWVLVKYGML